VTWVMWNLVSVRLEIVLVSVQDRCMICAKRSIVIFGRTRCNSMVTWVMWNLVLVRLEIVLVSVQDKCMVCTKHTIGSEIVLDALGGTQVTRLKRKLYSVRLEIVLIFTQDR
jgi:CO dehydrogenase/acetyl-CoA synthase alpha subunit